MANKGYLRPLEHAGELRQVITGLEAEGVAVDNILIADTPREALENLAPGDVLLVRSFAECGCSGLRDVLKLLQEAALRGGRVRSLGDPSLDRDISSFDWLSVLEMMVQIDFSCRSGKTRSALSRLQDEGRKLGRPLGSIKYKQQLQRSLHIYYRTDKSVPSICQETGISPRTFYRYITQNSLPNRRAIESDPSLNPLGTNLKSPVQESASERLRLFAAVRKRIR